MDIHSGSGCTDILEKIVGLSYVVDLMSFSLDSSIW